MFYHSNNVGQASNDEAKKMALIYRTRKAIEMYEFDPEEVGGRECHRTVG